MAATSRDRLAAAAYPDRHLAGPLSRAAKLAQFVRSTSPRRHLFAHPWRRDAAPYHFVAEPLSTAAHAGYARKFVFDRNGVPYRIVRGVPRYEPLVIARYALRLWSLGGLLGSQPLRAAARGPMEALLRSGETGVWSPGTGTVDAMIGSAPSAIVQGTVISALCRYATISGDPAIHRILTMALERLAATIERGGTRSTLADGPFLEEFPATRGHVLNGCGFALLGLYDVIDGLNWGEWRGLTRGVETTMVDNIDRFCTPYGWSRYSLDTFGHTTVASVHYHEQHIRLLTIVFRRTGDRHVRSVVARWKLALKSRRSRLVAACYKSAQSVVMRDIRRLPLH